MISNAGLPCSNPGRIVYIMPVNIVIVNLFTVAAYSQHPEKYFTPVQSNPQLLILANISVNSDYTGLKTGNFFSNFPDNLYTQSFNIMTLLHIMLILRVY